MERISWKPAVFDANDHDLFKSGQLSNRCIMADISDAFKPVFKIGYKFVIEFENIDVIGFVFSADKSRLWSSVVL